MAIAKGRIIKPKNTKEGLELVAKVYAKHQSDGSSSELNNLADFDWNTIGPGISLFNKSLSVPSLVLSGSIIPRSPFHIATFSTLHR